MPPQEDDARVWRCLGGEAEIEHVLGQLFDEVRVVAAAISDPSEIVGKNLRRIRRRGGFDDIHVHAVVRRLAAGVLHGLLQKERLADAAGRSE